jgi:hypothetical protein
MKDRVSEDIRLTIARDITAAYVRNEKEAVSPSQASEMFKAIYATVEELAPREHENRQVGIGLG